MTECGAGNCFAFLVQVGELYAIIVNMVGSYKVQLVKIENFEFYSEVRCERCFGKSSCRDMMLKNR